MLSLSYPISLTVAVGSSTGGHIIFLFAGSDCGGERAAAMYTLIGSAKLNGLDPELYLRTLLAKIADHPIRQIEDLLPWNMAPSLQTHSSQAA